MNAKSNGLNFCGLISDVNILWLTCVMHVLICIYEIQQYSSYIYTFYISDLTSIYNIIDIIFISMFT